MSASQQSDDSSLHRRRNRASYKTATSTKLSKAQETVFLQMELRKMQRELNGTQKKSNSIHLVALIVLLGILYGVGASYFENGQFTTIVTISLWQLVLIGVWFLLCVMVTSLFSDRHFIGLLYWMVIYWPLIAILISMLFSGQVDSDRRVNDVVLVFLIVAEVLTFGLFVLWFFVRPKIMQSAWFRNQVGWYYGVRVVADWTLLYDGRFRRRQTCKYQGDFATTTVADPSSSSAAASDMRLPSGFGQWMDDSHNGEVLAGAWHSGKPTAPFVSRRYGTGDAFRAVNIAYFMATDDEFGSNKLMPSNANPPRCGIASVECSVQGAFYNHLPAAQSTYGPHALGENNASMKECFHRMAQLGAAAEENRRNTFVGVSVGDLGVQVHNHVYEPTGLPFSVDSDRVLIEIKQDNYGAVTDRSSRRSQDTKFMPKRSHRVSHEEQVLVRDPSTEQTDDAIPASEESKHEDNGSSRKIVSAHFSNGDDEAQELEKLIPRDGSAAQLSVHNWVANEQKEVLVYLPGFNSCLKESLQTLGQFMAMTKVAESVIPVIFAWPNGLVPTYRYASAISNNGRNKENFLQLMRELSNAGIRDVHLMSHSMGVQSLLNVFSDTDDGSRSEVSKCFRLEPSFGDIEQNEKDLMTCHSITMVNPDYPTAAFVDRAFVTIRRVCNHITVVGDRGDRALYYSQLINGTMNFLGYEQPETLDDEATKSGERQKFSLQHVVGRDIESLYLPETNVRKDGSIEEGGADDVDERLLFRGAAPIILIPDGYVQGDRCWLDIDVIDTTQLDTNIKDLRHSGFNVNAILLHDLEELILTGRRAAHRSSLLFREGNIYSYCHAPSFVTM